VILREPSAVDRALHARERRALPDHALDLLVGSVEGELRGVHHDPRSLLVPPAVLSTASSPDSEQANYHTSTGLATSDLPVCVERLSTATRSLAQYEGRPPGPIAI
jgi:hypothetical protein